ncbi:MAG: SagB/ThcOx family dehydrogenase [Elusimicrobia bacterium]|nr:SagB/ThcOx family dehydrogenase [Elusimicrobiota bacterium]
MVSGKNLIALFFVAIILIFSNWGDKTMATDKTKTIKLPLPSIKSGVSVEECILKRRSVRTFSDKKLNQSQIGQLLWAAQGITAANKNFHLRAAPSAGALYPMETFAVTPDGIFKYIPKSHEIKTIDEGDKRKKLASAAWGQDFIVSAPLTIALCSVYSRLTDKYGKRGIRYAHIEAGHIAENIHLQAISLGLVSVPIGAFDDKKTADVLNLPDDCQPLYMIPIGFPQSNEKEK